jgi:hypothetical protein
MFQEVLPMRSVAQRSLLKSAQAYKAQIRRTPNLQRMPRRNLTGIEPFVIAGTANPVVVPLTMCCIGTGITCKIAWELYWYGTSETYQRIFGPKQHLHSEIDMHLKNISGIHGEKYIEPWQECLPAWMINQDLYSEARNPIVKKLSNEDARRLAGELGYIETKDGNFDCHGQLKFKKGNSIITPDVDQHSGGTWKEFNRRDERKGTLDRNGKKIGN